MGNQMEEPSILKDPKELIKLAGKGLLSLTIIVIGEVIIFLPILCILYSLLDIKQFTNSLLLTQIGLGFVCWYFWPDIVRTLNKQIDGTESSSKYKEQLKEEWLSFKKFFKAATLRLLEIALYLLLLVWDFCTKLLPQAIIHIVTLLTLLSHCLCWGVIIVGGRVTFPCSM